MKRTIACLFLGLAAAAPAAQEPARTFIPVSVSFLQSQEEMIPRIDDVSLKACIESYQQAASEALAGADIGEARGLLIAVGVKPGKKHFVWCEAVEGKLPQATQNKLDAAFAAVPRIEVNVGPIAYVIRGTLKDRSVKAFPQLPAVWTAAMDKSEKPFLTVEELFRIVWPESGAGSVQPPATKVEAFLMGPMLLHSGQMAKSGIGPQDTAGYLTGLIKAVNAALAGVEKQDARGLLIAVGIKPGKEVRVWCEAVEGSLAPETLETLESALEQVPTLDVRKKAFGFVLSGTLWGRTVKAFPQYPAAWLEGGKKYLKGEPDFDGLFKRIWPDKPSRP